MVGVEPLETKDNGVKASNPMSYVVNATDLFFTGELLAGGFFSRWRIEVESVDVVVVTVVEVARRHGWAGKQSRC